MRFLPVLIAVVVLGTPFVSSAGAQPVDVTKSNPMKVYMHIMPWFDTPEVLGGNNWGLHWTMANRNPNNVDATGKREIASHYYPKIGPYQSSNPNVLEYQMLLMKLSGVDGVLIDWYGVQGTNGDIGNLLNNSNAIVDKVDDFGLDFGVTLEDRFLTTTSGSGVPDINKAKANVAYLRDNYFNRSEYIRLSANQDPLMTVFGPITFTQPTQWTEILAEAGEDVEFLPLWYQSSDAGSNADGEFAWIYEDEALDDHLTRLTNFYQGRAPLLGTVGGAAYPGFFDFYDEGGWTGIPFEIPHDDGQTLADTFNLASQNSSVIDFLQLTTWNDFGEGTMFEPTVETGFDYLVQLQQFTGVEYGEAELELVYRLYISREKYAGDALIQAGLDQVASLLIGLEIAEAADLLETVAPLGDYDGDTDVDDDDYGVWVSEFNTRFAVHGSGADGNFNGIVDAADFTVWGDSLATFRSIPEPSSWLLVMLSLFAAGRRPARK